jgi:hypothetical protein
MPMHFLRTARLPTLPQWQPLTLKRHSTERRIAKSRSRHFRSHLYSITSSVRSRN